MVRHVLRPCILCRTCANSMLRESGAERRGPHRTCAAGLAMNDAFETCESYVRLHPLPMPHGARSTRDRA
jgi:hypothetical protein